MSFSIRSVILCILASVSFFCTKKNAGTDNSPRVQDTSSSGDPSEKSAAPDKSVEPSDFADNKSSSPVLITGVNLASPLNSEVRCDVKPDSATLYRSNCYVTVKTIDGAEVIATGLAKDTTINWNLARIESGNAKVVSCSVSQRNLYQECRFEVNAGLSNVEVSFDIRNLTDSRRKQSTFTLPFSVEVPAGNVASMGSPFYLSNVISFEAMPDTPIRRGIQRDGVIESAQVNLSEVQSECKVGDSYYILSGGKVFQLKKDKVQLFAGSANASMEIPANWFPIFTDPYALNFISSIMLCSQDWLYFIRLGQVTWKGYGELVPTGIQRIQLSTKKIEVLAISDELVGSVKVSDNSWTSISLAPFNGMLDLSISDTGIIQYLAFDSYTSGNTKLSKYEIVPEKPLTDTPSVFKGARIFIRKIWSIDLTEKLSTSGFLGTYERLNLVGYETSFNERQAVVIFHTCSDNYSFTCSPQFFVTGTDGSLLGSGEFNAYFDTDVISANRKGIFSWKNQILSFKSWDKKFFRDYSLPSTNTEIDKFLQQASSYNEIMSKSKKFIHIDSLEFAFFSNGTQMHLFDSGSVSKSFGLNIESSDLKYMVNNSDVHPFFSEKGKEQLIVLTPTRFNLPVGTIINITGKDLFEIDQDSSVWLRSVLANHPSIDPPLFERKVVGRYILADVNKVLDVWAKKEISTSTTNFLRHDRFQTFSNGFYVINLEGGNSGPIGVEKRDLNGQMLKTAVISLAPNKYSYTPDWSRFFIDSNDTLYFDSYVPDVLMGESRICKVSLDSPSSVNCILDGSAKDLSWPSLLVNTTSTLVNSKYLTSFGYWGDLWLVNSLIGEENSQLKGNLVWGRPSLFADCGNSTVKKEALFEDFWSTYQITSNSVCKGAIKAFSSFDSCAQNKTYKIFLKQDFTDGYNYVLINLPCF